MNIQLVAASALVVAGAAAALVAVINERRMQRHRRPGVSYASPILRRDGGWRRAELFSPQGLSYQRVAARFGVSAAALWSLAVFAWVVLST